MEDLGTKKLNNGGPIMRFSYNRLWKLLIDKNMNKQKLRELTGVSSASLAKMKRGQNSTTNVLLSICEALDCQPGDIMEMIPDEEKNEKHI